MCIRDSLRSIRDMKHVHDLFRLLPGGAIGTLEQSEIDRREQPAMSLFEGLLRVQAAVQKTHCEHCNPGGGLHPRGFGGARRSHRVCPAMPGRVIASTERIRSSSAASLSL